MWLSDEYLSGYSFVHTKTRNQLEQTETTWNHLERAGTTWNKLEREETSKNLEEWWKLVSVVVLKQTVNQLLRINQYQIYSFQPLTVFAKSFMLDDRILNTLLKCQLTIKYCTVFRNCILSTFSSCLACEPVVMLLSHLLLVYNQFNYKNLIWIFRNIWELRVKSTISYFFKATNSLLGKCVKYVQR